MTVAHSGTWIDFYEVRDTGKTKVWNVKTKEGGALGQVKWFGRWRTYCFFPAPATVFEPTCLLEISSFITNQNLARATTRRGRELQRAAP